MGIGEVEDDDVPGLPIRALQEAKGVGVVHREPGVVQGAAVERHDARPGPRPAGHRGVEVHQVHLLYVGVGQDATRGEPVAAAQDEHPRRAGRGEGRYHQRLVVAGLIDAGELQVPVEVQAQVITPPGDHQPGVGALVRVDDPVLVERVLDDAHRPVRARQGHQEQGQHARHDGQGAPGARQQGGQPAGDQGVEHAKGQAAAGQPQHGQGDQGEGHRAHQRAHVVEGQRVRARPRGCPPPATGARGWGSRDPPAPR